MYWHISTAIYYDQLKHWILFYYNTSEFKIIAYFTHVTSSMFTNIIHLSFTFEKFHLEFRVNEDKIEFVGVWVNIVRLYYRF